MTYPMQGWGTRTRYSSTAFPVLVLVRYQVIVLVLVLVGKYSGTRTSTCTDIFSTQFENESVRLAHLLNEETLIDKDCQEWLISEWRTGSHVLSLIFLNFPR